MIRKRYNVVFYGEIAEGFELKDVRQELVTQFQISPEESSHLFTGEPIVLREHLDYQAASIIVSSCSTAGAVCHIELAMVETEHGTMDVTKFCCVEFRGETLLGHKLEEVKRKVATLFHADIDKVEKLFTGKPVVIKHDVDYQKALDIQEKFARAGAVCWVKSSEKDLPLQATPRKMTCPKCGFEQQVARQCVQCGVVIQKYLERQQAAVETHKKEPGYREAGETGELPDNGVNIENEGKEEKVILEFHLASIWLMYAVGVAFMTLFLSLLGITFFEPDSWEFSPVFFSNIKVCGLLGLIFPVMLIIWNQGRTLPALRSILIIFMFLPVFAALVLMFLFRNPGVFVFVWLLYKIIGFSAIMYGFGMLMVLAFRWKALLAFSKKMQEAEE